MPFYGKRTLIRLYPSWNASKKKHIDRYIKVAYGNDFLMKLKISCNRKKQGKAVPKKDESEETSPRRTSSLDCTDENKGLHQDMPPEAAPDDSPGSRHQPKSSEDSDSGPSSSKNRGRFVMTRSRRRRVCDGVSSFSSGVKQESRSTQQIEEGEEDAGRMPGGSAPTGVNARSGSSRNVPKVRDDRSVKEDDELKAASSHTHPSLDPGEKGKTDQVDESPMSTHRHHKEGPSLRSAAKQAKGETSGLPGGDEMTVRRQKQKMVEDKQYGVTCPDSKESGVTAERGSEQSAMAEDWMKEDWMKEDDATLKEAKGNSIKDAISKTSSAPTEKQDPVRQQQRSSAGKKKKRPKGRHIEEEDSSSTAGGECINPSVESEQNRKDAAKFQKPQRLNVEVEVSAESGSNTSSKQGPVDLEQGRTYPGKRRRFTRGPRTRARDQRASRRNALGLRGQVSSADSETDDISLKQTSTAVGAEKQRISIECGTEEPDEGGTSSTSRAVAPPKVPRLRKTRRKSCPQTSRSLEDAAVFMISRLGLHPVASSPTTEPTRQSDTSERRTSVRILKTDEGKVSKEKEAGDGDAKTASMQGDFGGLQNTREARDEDREGFRQSSIQLGPETPEQEELTAASDCREILESEMTTIKSVEVGHSEQQGSAACDRGSPSGITGQSQSPIKEFVGVSSKMRTHNGQDEDTTCQDKESILVNATCSSPVDRKSSPGRSSWREESSRVIKARCREQYDLYHGNLRVVAHIEDVPLLEDDDKETDQSHPTDPESQDVSTSTSTAKGAHINEEASDADESVVNESVGDDSGIPPLGSPIPGLSQLKRNPVMMTGESPIFGVLPKMTREQIPRRTKMTSRQENPESTAGTPNPSEDILQETHPRTHQESRKIKGSIPRLRHQNTATITKKAQPEAGYEKHQSTAGKEMTEITSAAPQVPDDASSSSGTEPVEKGDIATEKASVAKEAAVALRKVRTAAEKKQGWFNSERQNNRPPRPFPGEDIKESYQVKDNGKGRMALDQPATGITDAAKEAHPLNKMTSQGSRKRRRNESSQERVRGLMSGWEESLRQKPATVSKFQAGDSNPKPTSSSSGNSETTLKKARWQSPVKAESSAGTRFIPSPPAHQQRPSDKVMPFRQVMKPPPAKKLKLSDSSAERTELKEVKESSALPSSESSTQEPSQVLQDKFRFGEIVWGKMRGFNWWPARVVHHHSCGREAAHGDACWLHWFGDKKYSKLCLSQVTPFFQFSAHFSQSSFLHTALYRKAVFQALHLACTRASKTFDSDPSDYSSELPKHSKRSDPAWLKFLDLCKEMVSWAKAGFQPSGQESIMPSAEEQELPPRPQPPPSPPTSPTVSTPTKKTTRTSTKGSSAWKDTRDTAMAEIRNGIRDIEDMCIGCGSFYVTAEHPFFVGGLCEVCRIEFMEVTYIFDEDGYQCFCCICAEGKEIVLCDQTECYRSFCYDCIDYLVGPGTVQKVLATEKWKCYMCDPEPNWGLLSRRADWPQKLLLFFQQDCSQDVALKPVQTYLPVEMERRKPIRVLSLFDGIGTGMLVLKELGVKVECYYASEINEEAIQVSSVRHDGVIQQLDDVTRITVPEIQALGPFDLVIGGSPCNDLSIANPARKGLFEGTGRLFFDFFRILTACRPQAGDESHRPFFWLFENVVGMKHQDKMDISRFLQCHPVIVDAKDVSPAHRARYFWGNLPGMNRPNVATENNSLSLQDCLEPNCNRQAQFSKVRTVTSKLNSIKQKNEQVLPVLMNGQEDTLWCTEMERIFGFPEHYTDIANMSRSSRHKLIGQAWSVPVIKHLLAPLKEYFACETQK